LSPADWAEILIAEQWRSWQRGERTSVETYLKNHSALAADREAACNLIYGEFLLRQELGEKPRLEEYQARFPGLAADLAELYRSEQLNELLPWFMAEPLAERGTVPEVESQAQAGAPDVPDHELLAPIGAGTFGQVWYARNRHDQGSCAVKVIADLHKVELHGLRLYRQYAADHPHLVPIKYVGELASGYYCVMPLADDLNGNTGPADAARYRPMTLGAYLAAHGRLPLVEVVQISRQLLSALGHLHEHGVIHCDVKPDNIMRVQGNWRLGDVGLMSLEEELKGQRGTMAFWPPEGPRDQTADLYALGKTLYLLLTGESLERFGEFLAKSTTHIGGRGRAMGVQRLIRKACQAEAAARFQSAQEMSQAADHLVVRRERAVKFSIFVVVLVLIGTGVFQVQRRLRPTDFYVQPELPAEGIPSRLPELTLPEAKRVRVLADLIEQHARAGRFSEARDVASGAYELNHPAQIGS
jgi:hypothetical protein